MPAVPGERLEAWKEIAAYLKRDVATVRRWEKREGLPVHRHVHQKLGSVYAYRSELDSWLEGRRQQLAPPQQAAAPQRFWLLIPLGSRFRSRAALQTSVPGAVDHPGACLPWTGCAGAHGERPHPAGRGEVASGRSWPLA
jgi:hypothetical protein